jgi:hypothetical protein
MTSTSLGQTTYTVRRLTVAVPGVRVFQRAYEDAVPDLLLSEVQELLRRAAPWQEMVDLIHARAPNGFVIYFRLVAAAAQAARSRPRSRMRRARSRDHHGGSGGTRSVRRLAAFGRALRPSSSPFFPPPDQLVRVERKPDGGDQHERDEG